MASLRRIDGVSPARRVRRPAADSAPTPQPAAAPSQPSWWRAFWRLPQFASLHAVSAGVLAALIAVCAISFLPRQSHFEPAPAAIAATSVEPAPTPAAAPILASKPKVATPVDRLSIPTLGINAPIIHVGLVAGQLDAPKTLYQVGWYQGSSWPGKSGTAVIDGHSGAPGQVGVFEHLNRLKPGSFITITAANGVQTTFIVRTSGAFPANEATAAQAFTQTLAPTLNLISCYGKWNPANQSYDQRWIVTAVLR